MVDAREELARLFYEAMRTSPFGIITGSWREKVKEAHTKAQTYADKVLFLLEQESPLDVSCGCSEKAEDSNV